MGTKSKIKRTLVNLTLRKPGGVETFDQMCEVKGQGFGKHQVQSNYENPCKRRSGPKK